jgi:hypothetical protein
MVTDFSSQCWYLCTKLQDDIFRKSITSAYKAYFKNIRGSHTLLLQHGIEGKLLLNGISRLQQIAECFCDILSQCCSRPTIIFYSSEDTFSYLTSLSVVILRASFSESSSSEFRLGDRLSCRSQWLRGLRHELSSLARRLGSWVRIPHKSWMSVFVYSVLE